MSFRQIFYCIDFKLAVGNLLVVMLLPPVRYCPPSENKNSPKSTSERPLFFINPPMISSWKILNANWRNYNRRAADELRKISRC